MYDLNHAARSLPNRHFRSSTHKTHTHTSHHAHKIFLPSPFYHRPPCFLGRLRRPLVRPPPHGVLHEQVILGDEMAMMSLWPHRSKDPYVLPTHNTHGRNICSPIWRMPRFNDRPDGSRPVRCLQANHIVRLETLF